MYKCCINGSIIFNMPDMCDVRNTKIRETKQTIRKILKYKKITELWEKYQSMRKLTKYEKKWQNVRKNGKIWEIMAKYEK